MTGDCAVRKAEDVGGQELSYAEVKAIASGNPAVLTLAETDAELQRLAILRKNHHDGQYLARRSLKELPDKVRSLANRIDKLGQDVATLHQHAQDRVTVGNRPLSTTDAVEAITARMDRMPTTVSEARTVPLGLYRGLAFGVMLHAMGGLEAYLDGHLLRRTELRDNAGARAVLNAVERIAGSYQVERERAEQDKAVAEGQLVDFESRLGAVFQHLEYERTLTELRDKLKSGLSEKPSEEKAEGPTVAELDAQIKALRAANTVQGDAQRIGAKPVPVRRVREAAKVVEPVPELPQAEVIELPAPEHVPETTWESRHRNGRSGGSQLSLF